MTNDRLASVYLSNLKAKMTAPTPLIPIFESELVRLTDSHTETVILARATEPRYFAGVLGRGGNQRPVWVPKPEQAQQVLADRVYLYEDKLGVELTSQQI